MTDINVIWLSLNEAPNHGYWCYGWLEEAFSNINQEPTESNTFYWGNQIEDVPDDEGAIVIIPAEYHKDNVAELNATIATLPWAIVVVASDEGGLFPIEDLAPVHGLWVMTPHFEKHTYPEGTQFLSVYYPQDARGLIAQFKSLALGDRQACSFSGQITHDRRYKMVEALEADYPINKTAGFTQGLGRREYYELLAGTRVTPAPSGPVTVDSFRAFETLESGGVPILDLVCPAGGGGAQYWNAILGDQHPVPVIDDWRNAWLTIEDVGDTWPHSSNLVFSWWQTHKRELKHRILADVPGIETGPLTILIPTSPIPSHPDTRVIDQTIESVRFHHPTAEILIMIDGVRPEQEHRREDYEKYVQSLVWDCNFRWNNVVPIVFPDHQHQANMTRETLDYVRTPLVMFVEHDTPLVLDWPYDWENLFVLSASDDIDMIRFHFESHIHPEHEFMTIDKEVITMHGVPVRRTVQWSQRPHLAKAEYYRRILRDHFPATGRTMVEDKMHSVAQEWPERNRIAIYHPEGTSIIRSAHTDGREDDEKFPMVYE